MDLGELLGRLNPIWDDWHFRSNHSPKMSARLKSLTYGETTEEDRRFLKEFANEGYPWIEAFISDLQLTWDLPQAEFERLVVLQKLKRGE